MGNKNSAAAPKETQAEGYDTLVSSSGVFLANDLNAEIVSQFQSKEIQLKWQSLQNNILADHNNRTAKEELRKLEVERKIQEWRDDNDMVQKQLDEKTDQLRSRFADVEFALSHDMSKLENKFDSVPKFGGENSCLSVRSDLVSCYKSKTDTRECVAFVKAMEQCAKQSVMGSA